MMITIIFVVCIYMCIKANKEYKSSTYYNITGNSVSSLYSDKGRLAEYYIYKELKDFEYKTKFLFNVYIPKNDEETTEIDVIMISTKGIFVFESKNYSGWIWGNESSKMWTQTLPNGRYGVQKFKFYNPIIQNRNHINWLKKLIDKESPFYSFVIFSDRCELKQVPIGTKEDMVLKRKNVKMIIDAIYKEKPDVMDLDRILDIYHMLYPYTQVGEKTKMLHIANIENKYKR